MISKFVINELFNEKNIELNFEKSALIITGDNGNGKTTILNILYYILSGTVQELMDYEFSQAIIFFQKEFKEVKKIEVFKFDSGDRKELKIAYFFKKTKIPDIEINCERSYNSDKIIIDYMEEL
ncbi:TPA: AAA family ATPase, partial [Enterococcus faecium]